MAVAKPRSEDWKSPATPVRKTTLRGDAKPAGVVKLVDAPDSKSGSERSVGSTPTARTNNLIKDLTRFRRFMPNEIVRFAVISGIP